MDVGEGGGGWAGLSNSDEKKKRCDSIPVIQEQLFVFVGGEKKFPISSSRETQALKY